MDTGIMDFFPQGYTPRQIQIDALLEYERLVELGYEIIIIRGETGAGKSIVAKTISNEFNYRGLTSMFTTPSKILQDQYQRDFPEVPVVKGKSNFECVFPGSEGIPCNRGPCEKNKIKKCTQDAYDRGVVHAVCPYIKQIDAAIMAPVCIINYHILWHLVGKRMSPRDLVIMDEAHNLESIMQGFVSTKFEGDQFFDIDMNPNDPEILIKLQTSVKAKLLYFEREILTDAEIKSKQDLMSKDTCLDYLINQPRTELVIWNPDLTPKERRDHARISLEVKPIFIGQFISTFLNEISDFFCFFSATISKGEFCSANGLDPDLVGFIDMPSGFPVENAPVLNYFKQYAPNDTYSVNYRNQEFMLKLMIPEIQRLCGELKDARILIHTHSNRIENYLKDHFRIDTRPVLFGSNYTDKDAMVKEYLANEKSILFSFSAYEGLDLPDAHCRAVFFLKIPYLPMVDPWIKARSDYRYPDGTRNDFYLWETLKKLIQGSARHIRNDQDFGLTIFMDCPNRVISDGYHLLPMSFKQRLTQRGDAARLVLNKIQEEGSYDVRY